VHVEAGTTTTVDLVLEVGGVSESITVRASAPMMRFDHHQVAGLVSREQIDSVPLNGRNFLELAKLEPGVTNLVRATNNRSLVPVLGAGLQTLPRIGYTAVTIDGASVTAPGTIGSGMQVSPDVVQRLPGGRIHLLSRSPSLRVSGVEARSRESGPILRAHSAGRVYRGALRTDGAFFFASYERTDQQSVFSVQPAQFPALGGIFPSPYEGTQLSARVDVRLNAAHNTFARYTHDGNRAFAPGGGLASSTLLPSAWSRLANHVDQSVAGMTSLLSANLVNDARVSYFYSNTPESPAGPADCLECVGLMAARISIQGMLTMGGARTLSYIGRRHQVTDTLSWQRGTHRVRVGVDWQHSSITDAGFDNEHAVIMLFSPAATRQFNAGVPPEQRIPLPQSFVILDDLLQLPLRSFRTGVGPPASLQRGFTRDRIIDQYRLFVSDTWRLHARLTVNAGLGWMYEPNALNHDLVKPVLLAPILGADGLGPPAAQLSNVSTMVGASWATTRDARTVIHAGAGRYYDPAASANATSLLNERYALSPLGTGRLTESGSNIQLDGRTLDFLRPSTFTGAHLLANLPEIKSRLATALNPGNRDLSIRNIDRLKEASSLYDPFYRTPYADHVNAGLQREVTSTLLVGADFVWKRFCHTVLSGIDYNRWDSAAGSLIPAYPPDRSDDVTAACSNGPFNFSNTVGRARYLGLLARANARPGRRAQVRASYALGSFTGINGPGVGTGFNSGDWTENDGPLPTDVRHGLSLSGVVDLPADVQVAFILAAYSPPPLSAYVNQDFNGDGTATDLLPGTTVNQLGRGLDERGLAVLVDEYNQRYAIPGHPAGRLLAP
jgi:hypothetical protein